MIVLLSCSINLSANNDVVQHNPFTGERITSNDSVMISYDDLRIVNSKLIELNYEKQININLRNIISNDSILIHDYKVLNDKIKKEYNKEIRVRNIAIGSAALFFITTIITLFVK